MCFLPVTMQTWQILPTYHSISDFELKKKGFVFFLCFLIWLNLILTKLSFHSRFELKKSICVFLCFLIWLNLILTNANELPIRTHCQSGAKSSRKRKSKKIEETKLIKQKDATNQAKKHKDSTKTKYKKYNLIQIKNKNKINPGYFSYTNIRPQF